MIFRDKDGELINIKRKNYYSESDYYNKIIDLKGYRILDSLEKYSENDYIFEKMNQLMSGAVSSK